MSKTMRSLSEALCKVHHDYTARLETIRAKAGTAFAFDLIGAKRSSF